MIDDKVSVITDGEAGPLLPIEEIPVTLNGAAAHNVYNVLGVVGLCLGLNLPRDAIVEGLRGMNPNDNPGRSNLYRINGATFIVDFAHNPHGMKAFVSTTRDIPAKRRTLLIGQAGDRSDDDIKGLAATASDVDWNQIVIKRMDHYARGRNEGEVANILHDEFIARGFSEARIRHEENEVEAVKRLVETAKEEDLIVLLIHESRAEVLDYLNSKEPPH